jgi:hypothetical protein
MPSDIDEIHAFLLGTLPEEKRDAFEERMFGDEEFFDRVEFAEDELIDAYITKELSSALRSRFEASFLQSPRRRDRLRLAVALSEFRTHSRQAKPDPWPERIAAWLWNVSKWPLPTAAACGLAVLFGALSIWLGSTLMHERRIAAYQRQMAEQQLAELRRRTTSAPPQQAQNPPQPEPPAKAPGKRDQQINLAVLLLPNATRGEDLAITVPAGAKSLQLTLRSLTAITPGRYRAIIRDRSQHDIWQTDVFQRPGNQSNTIAVAVPANVLSPGVFTLALSAYQADGNLESIADYAFHVVR